MTGDPVREPVDDLLTSCPALRRPILESLSENSSGLTEVRIRCSCGVTLVGSFMGTAFLGCNNCGSRYGSRTLTRVGYLDDHGG